MKHMSDSLTDKIDRIEALLIEVNAKISNFLGFEELDEAEQAEVKTLRKSIDKDGHVSFERVFGE